MTSPNRERALTVRWNNALTVALGLPALIYAAVALFTSAISGRAAFIGLVIIGAFY